MKHKHTQGYASIQAAGPGDSSVRGARGGMQSLWRERESGTNGNWVDDR